MQRLLGGPGNDRAAVGAALQIIGERPDIQDQIRKDRSLIPNFVEEALRIESPVKGTSACPGCR